MRSNTVPSVVLNATASGRILMALYYWWRVATAEKPQDKQAKAVEANNTRGTFTVHVCATVKTKQAVRGKNWNTDSFLFDFICPALCSYTDFRSLHWARSEERLAKFFMVGLCLLSLSWLSSNGVNWDLVWLWWWWCWLKTSWRLLNCSRTALNSHHKSFFSSM